MNQNYDIKPLRLHVSKFNIVAFFSLCMLSFYLELVRMLDSAQVSVWLQMAFLNEIFCKV